MSVWRSADGNVTERTRTANGVKPPRQTMPKNKSTIRHSQQTTPSTSTTTESAAAGETEWLVDYQGQLVTSADKVDTGYISIQQLVTMIRSSIVTQRAPHLILLGNLFKNAIRGQFGDQTKV